ncbi:MAG: hypothetical protein WD597_07125 [Balneolaceae bacterium]
MSIGLAEAQSPNKTLNEDVEMRIPASEFDAKTIFMMKNINGDVEVTGYDGDEILITGVKSLYRKRGEVTPAESDEIHLEKYRSSEKLIVYIKAPNVEVNEKNDDLHYHIHWDDNKRDKNRVQFTFFLELKVPNYLMAEISTINGGELLVENMKNGVNASNVNGNITIREVRGEIGANTVNGNITVGLVENPTTDVRFNTVNGTIEVEAPKNLSAVVTFKSLHGDLYTDFENVEHLPSRLNKISNAGAKSYRVEQTSPIQIGSGGPEINFHLVNGNAYIKQIKS